MNKFIHGVIFWNEKTNEEIFTYLEASNFWEADDIAQSYQLPSFVKGIVHYLVDSMETVHSDYDTKLEDVVRSSES